MKTLFVIVALCAAVVSVTGLAAKLEEKLATCLEESKMTKEEARTLCKDGARLRDKPFDFRYLVACVFYATEIVNTLKNDPVKTVDVIPEKVANLVPAANVAEAKKIVKNCEAEAEDDRKTAWAAILIMDKLAQSNLKEIVCDSLVDITDA